MPSLTAVPRLDRRQEHLDSESLEQLVLICLEGLAKLAHAHGEQHRAARLLDAVELLRQEADPPDPSTALTRREWDTATLIARAWSNRRIAEELSISERTVDTHVSHILRKLGLVSRVEIAAWVIERQPRLSLVGQSS
jgi:DNA-binding NarL/FixJ family response regulator